MMIHETVDKGLRPYPSLVGSYLKRKDQAVGPSYFFIIEVDDFVQLEDRS